MDAKRLLGDLLFRIVGDKTLFDKTLADSETAAHKTGANITGNLKNQFREIDMMLGGLGSKLSSLLTNPLVLAATAVLGLGKAFSDTTKALMLYSEQINDISDQTGLSTKAVQEYKFIADQTGSSVERITNSVKLMTRGLDTNAETFDRLGVKTKDATGNFRGANEIFDDTIAALSGVSNETERSKLALELFGRDALSMVPLLKLGAEGLEDLKDKAHSLGLVLSEETIRRTDEFKDSTDALKAAWKNFSMSIVADAVPVLAGLENKLIETLQILSTWGQVKKNQEIVEAFQKGKATVTEYHDALKALIDYNQTIVSSDTATAKNKQIALAEIQKAYRALDAVAREYGKAQEEQNKKEAAAAKANAAAEALKAEEERVNALRAARDEAAAKYKAEIEEIAQLEAAGLRTTEAAQKEVTEATRKYAETLAPIVAASRDRKIGAEALKKALEDLTIQENRLAKASSDARLASQYVQLQEALRNNQAQRIIAAEKARGEALEKLGAKFIADQQRIKDAEEARYAAMQQRGEDYLAKQAEIAAKVAPIWQQATGIMRGLFSQLGTDLANNELSWKSLGTAAINAIGAIVSALGDELAADAAKTLVQAIAASVNPLEMYAAPGLYASAAIKGGGAAAAWASGALLEGVSLASGGVASSPTVAVVGDNRHYREMVAPLSPDFFASLGDGLLGALASRSRPAGVTEATVAAARGPAPRSGGGMVLQVGTLIADDGGMRKLNRNLRKFGLQEDVRVGA